MPEWVKLSSDDYLRASAVIRLQATQDVDGIHVRGLTSNGSIIEISQPATLAGARQMLTNIVANNGGEIAK